jgi:alpha-N-arabinofuranosidase
VPDLPHLDGVFHNPVIRGFHPDPSICRVGDDYYLAVSSFEFFPGVPLFHSRDLVNWRKIGHALTRRSQLELSQAGCSEGTFAPTLRHHAGTFYLVTTNVGGGGNFLVTATDPAGPWSDPVWIDAGAFDPSLCFDDDGRVYYTRREGKGIAQAELDPRSGRLLTPLRTIAEAFSSNDAEGPHLYKIDGRYYLLCAEGGTGYGHMVTIGRSASPWGPFESCPWNPILTHRHILPHPIRYTGHGDLVQAADGTWWMVFLGTRHHPSRGYCFHVLGREVFLAPVAWRDGWPVVNEGQPIESLGRFPSGQPVTGHAIASSVGGPERDDFDGTGFGVEWTWLRNPELSWYDRRTRPGWLALRCAPLTLGQRGSPAFVGRRQEEWAFRAATKIEFVPQGREEAGLALYHNAEFHCMLVIGVAPTGRAVRLRWRAAELEAVVGEVTVPDGPLELSVIGDLEFYRFYVCAPGDDGAKQEVGKGSVRLLSTEVATGWTGVFVGLHATAQGQVSSNAAAFDWFAYENRGDRDSHQCQKHFATVPQ